MILFHFRFIQLKIIEKHYSWKCRKYSQRWMIKFCTKTDLKSLFSTMRFFLSIWMSLNSVPFCLKIKSLEIRFFFWNKIRVLSTRVIVIVVVMEKVQTSFLVEYDYSKELVVEVECKKTLLNCCQFDRCFSFFLRIIYSSIEKRAISFITDFSFFFSVYVLCSSYSIYVLLYILFFTATMFQVNEFIKLNFCSWSDIYHA